MSRKFVLVILTLACLVSLSGCVTEVTPTLPAATAAQATLNFMLTQVALATKPSETPEPSSTPTISPTPEPSEEPTEIATVEFVTKTPDPNRPTPEGPTPTLDATLLLTRTLTPKCYAAFFVGDVGPVQDMVELKPNAEFTKVWDVRNIGTCTWDRGFRLWFRYGAHMNGPDYIQFPSIVPPNGHIFLQATMYAPSKEGTYEGQWYFQATDDTRFGLGENGDFPLLVRIKVVP
jgi:hypothetical protein